MKDVPFALLAEGPFDPSSITFRHTDQTIVHTPELDELIEGRWQKVSGGDPNFPNTPKVLVKRVSSKGDGLEIVTGMTDFRERVGTQRQEVAERFGMQSVAVTLGITGVIETADNALILASRKTPHRTKGGGLHVIGGMADISDIVNDTIDICAISVRETSEETGIPRPRLEIVSCLGVMQSTESYAIDILLASRTDMSEKEIRSLQGDGEVDLFFIENSPTTLRHTLLSYLKTASRPSIAALYLYGLQKFGQEWRTIVEERFSIRNQLYKQFTPELAERARARLARRLTFSAQSRINI
ncbi:NUDIX hydrolase [Candidatus Daviesbacteria bacterium]|nr:NUDIX hydrolase [Candidatus Daviesbacteria bacterium]